MSDIQPRVAAPDSYYNFYNFTDNSLFLSYAINSESNSVTFSNSTLEINDKSWKITTQINEWMVSYSKPYHVFLIFVNEDGSGECVEEKIYDNGTEANKLQEFTFNFENTSCTCGLILGSATT